MKRLFLLLMIIVLAVPVIAVAGTEEKEPAAVEEAPRMEAEPEGDELDPWILEKHQIIEKYQMFTSFRTKPSGNSILYITILREYLTIIK